MRDSWYGTFEELGFKGLGSLKEKEDGFIVTSSRSGKWTAMITSTDGNGYLSILGRGEKDLVVITTAMIGGSVHTYNRDGRELVQLGFVEGEREGQVSTFGGNGGQLVTIGATKDGEGAIATFNRAGGVRAQWP